MFCGECGIQNPDTNQFCKNCGKPLRKSQQAPASQPPGPAQPVATPPPVQPVYYAPQPPVVPQATPAIAGTAATAKPSGNKMMGALGVVSLVFGVISWFRYPYIFGLLAIVCGGIVLFKSGNIKSKSAILGILGIIVGLATIITDIFYFTIFPTPHVVL